MNVRLLVICGFVVALLLSAKPASACQCAGESGEEALGRAKLVVVGTVDGERRSDDHRSQSIVRFRDVRALRGEHAGSTLSLGNGNDCAPQTLEIGKRYVLYLGSPDTTITACSRVVDASRLTPIELGAFPSLGASSPSVSSSPSATPDATPSPSTPRAPSVGGCASCEMSVGDTRRALPWTIGLLLIVIGRRASSRRARVSELAPRFATCAGLAASLVGLRCVGEPGAPRGVTTSSADIGATLPSTTAAASAPVTAPVNAPVNAPSARMSWAELPRLVQARRGHTLTSLADGGLVVVGGLAPDGTALDSIEVLDRGASRWRIVGKLATARSAHGSVVMDDGRVLAIGGRGATEHAPLVSTELIDAKTGVVVAGPSLATGLYGLHPLVTGNGEVWIADGVNDLGDAYPPQRLARGAKSFVETPSTGAAPTTAWVDGSGIVTLESGRSEAIAPVPRFKRWLNAGRRPLQPIVAAIDVRGATELPHALPSFGVASSVSLDGDALIVGELSAATWRAWRFDGKQRIFVDVVAPPTDFVASSFVSAPRGGAFACTEDRAWLFDGASWRSLQGPPKGLWDFPIAVTPNSIVLAGGVDRASSHKDQVSDRAAELTWITTP